LKPNAERMPTQRSPIKKEDEKKAEKDGKK
jgi:hypothetical protein